MGVPYIGDLLGFAACTRSAGPPSPSAAGLPIPWAIDGERAQSRCSANWRKTSPATSGGGGDVLSAEWTRSQPLPIKTPTPDLRDSNSLELIQGAFTKGSFTGDVRSVQIPRGKYNIPNIGIFLWRLQHFPLHRTKAVKDSRRQLHLQPAGSRGRSSTRRRLNNPPKRRSRH